jgi:hypothetical protein
VKYAAKLGEGLPIPQAHPMDNGGGSGPDWRVDRDDGVDMTILDKDGHTWVLPSNTNTVPVGRENTNTALWHHPAPGGLCMVAGK